MKIIFILMFFITNAIAQTTTTTLPPVWKWPIVDGTNGMVMKTDGAGQLGWTTTSGSHPDPHRLGDGSEAAPTYSFSGDQVTGMYRASAGVLGLSGGYAHATIGLVNTAWPKLTLIGNTSNGNGTYGAVIRAEEADATGAPLFIDAINIVAPVGAEHTPTYTFSGDQVTGMYRASAGVLGLSGGNAHATIGLVNTEWPKLTLIGNTSNGNGTYGAVIRAEEADATGAPLVIDADGVRLPVRTYSTLPLAANGVILYCSDCSPTSPPLPTISCTNGTCTVTAAVTTGCSTVGSGAVAVKTSSGWRCF